MCLRRLYKVPSNAPRRSYGCECCWVACRGVNMFTSAASSWASHELVQQIISATANNVPEDAKNKSCPPSNGTVWTIVLFEREPVVDVSELVNRLFRFCIRFAYFFIRAGHSAGASKFSRALCWRSTQYIFTRKIPGCGSITEVVSVLRHTVA